MQVWIVTQMHVGEPLHIFDSEDKAYETADFLEMKSQGRLRYLVTSYTVL